MSAPILVAYATRYGSTAEVVGRVRRRRSETQQQSPPTAQHLIDQIPLRCAPKNKRPIESRFRSTQTITRSHQSPDRVRKLTFRSPVNNIYTK